MSSYAGALLSPLLTDFDEVSYTPSVPGPNSWPLASNACLVLDGALSGDWTSNAPIEMPAANHAGVLLPGFAFGHVYALPTSDIDLGTVIDGAESTVELWNASLAVVTCSNDIESEMDGITHDTPATPFTLDPLASQVVTYVIGSGGPVDIAAFHSFVFSTDTVVISFVGTRAVVLTNWPQDEVVETISYLTDILTSWAGREQRIQVRQEPRRTIKYVIWPQSPALAQRLENQVQAWRANTWSLPLYQEAERLAVSPSDGDTTVSVDTSNMTLAVGDMVCIWWSETATQTLPVEALTSSSITVTKPLSPPSGHAGPVYAIPVQLARFASAPTKERQPAVQDKYTLEFRLLDDRDIGSGLSLPQYLDLDVFVYPTRLLQAATQPVTFTRVVSEVDYSTGKVFFSSPSDFTAQQVQVDIVAIDRAAAFTARQFVARCNGRRVPFWYPNYDTNMTTTQTIGASDTTILVEDCGFSILSGHQTRTHLFIEITSGTQFFRQVTSIARSETGIEVLVLSDALGVEISKAQIKTLCFLNLVRLDQDDTELTWGTAPSLKTSLMVQEVAQ